MTPEQKAAEYADQIWKGYEDVFSKAVIDKGSEAYKQAFLSGAQWQRGNEWISVGEQMPEDRRQALVWNAQSKCVEMMYRKHGNWYYWDGLDRLLDFDIQLWQYCPTPPKTKEDESMENRL